MRGTSRRAGPIGTQMGSNSRKAALRRNLPALIKAKDILTVHERGISEIGPNVLDVCRIATESPSILTVGQSRMVWAVWQELAEANKLHGIRTANAHADLSAASADKVRRVVGHFQNQEG